MKWRGWSLIYLGLGLAIGFLLGYSYVGGPLSPSFFQPILQGTVLAAIIGGIFAVITNELTAKRRVEQFRFERLFPKQVDAVESIIGKLNDLNGKMQALVSPLQPASGIQAQIQTLPIVQQSAQDFADCFSKNRIYLRPKARKIIETLMSDYAQVYAIFNSYLRATPPVLPPDTAWSASWMKITSEFVETRADLEAIYDEVFGNED